MCAVNTQRRKSFRHTEKSYAQLIHSSPATSLPYITDIDAALFDNAIAKQKQESLANAS